MSALWKVKLAPARARVSFASIQFICFVAIPGLHFRLFCRGVMLSPKGIHEGEIVGEEEEREEKNKSEIRTNIDKRTVDNNNN